MCHYLDLARSLIVDAQGRAATPCSGLNADPNVDLEMAILGDSAWSQSSNVFDGFDWRLASTMALDELPDSDLCYRPEYQLTQEWLDHTIKCLNEIDEEKRVAAERKVAEIGADVETGSSSNGPSNGGNEAWSDS
jgi:hypothetical protein